jgi:hypothetical protein
MVAEQFAERRSESQSSRALSVYMHAAGAHYIFNTFETRAAEAGKNNSAPFCRKRLKKDQANQPRGAHSPFPKLTSRPFKLNAGILLGTTDAQVADLVPLEILNHIALV